MDSDAFKRALGQFASGVTVVTVHTPEGGDHGMTASAFCSLSLDPPLVLVCVKKGNATHEFLEESQGFAINLLCADQQELSNRFAGGYIDEEGRWQRWPAERDKFADLSIRRAEHSGAALLAGTLAGLDCSLYGAREGGDHTIFLGEVQAASFPDEAPDGPLVYFSGRYRDLN